MKRSTILAILLVLSSISCSSVTYQPFTYVKYPPTQKVDLYTDEKPTREYIEIGRIISGEDALTGEKNMVKWALEKAKKIGADGLIWVKDEKQFYAIPSQGSVIAAEEKKIVFVAIKYKS